MVVMEGTTNTQGKLDGNLTDPGAFSGGVRNFLLSDRWFSWDSPIELAVGTTSTTGLAEEIKKLMINHRPQVLKPIIQKPILPNEPRKTGSVVKAVQPVEPIKPKMPTEPSKPDFKPWYRHFISTIIRGSCKTFFHQFEQAVLKA
jgi:hypothetical protein